MKKIEWRLHPEHGYMLLGPVYEGWRTCVTSLCLHTRETERNQAAWEAHKSRLRVNGGCGAVAVDAMEVGNVNPAFRRVAQSRVPVWIVEEFVSYLGEEV